MAHWAEIDENNIVIRVLVMDNNHPDGKEGYDWLIENLGGTWIKTSYNNKIRKQFAGERFTYNPDADVFIAPCVFQSWTLDENFDWQAPKPKPEGDFYWSEEEGEWIAYEA